MVEVGQLSNLRISLPVDLDSVILVFEILKEVQSFVGIEFVANYLMKHLISFIRGT